jgi:lipoyl(octanoyl) transferase
MGRRAWHLWIDEPPRPGWANMAIDLALLDRADQAEGWLRLYRWDPHCLSFGRHEPAARRYDADRVRALGLDTVRRPTGGRAVWHARELTYALAAPQAWFGSLQEGYRAIHEMLAEALGSIGVPARLAPRGGPAALEAGPCFSQPVGGEVLVNGRKVIGSAQLRRGTALLQHGSIILQDGQQLLHEVIRGLPAPRAQPHPAAGATLRDGGGSPVPADSLATTIGHLAVRRWPGEWETATDPAMILQAASPHFERFRSPAWTWGR